MKKVINITLVLLGIILSFLGGYFLLQKDKYYENIDSVAVLQSVEGVYEVAFDLKEEIRIEEEKRLEVERLASIKLELEGKYELPLENSMGISVTNQYMKKEPDSSSANAASLKTGDTYLILKEADDEWLYVELKNGTKGYIPMIQTFINLPDIIPSIQYKITNSDASIFRSSGYPLENITGLKKYSNDHYNARFDKQEYVVPVMYPMAEKIQKAQTEALTNGNTLIIYESYRPYSLQKEVVTSLQKLMDSNEEVYKGVNTSPWHTGWFISTNLSNHQRACAIDVSLGSVDETVRLTMGDIEYNNITKYTEYKMQTDMHELSIKSTSLVTPVTSLDEESWKSVGTSEAMTGGSILLREYCTNAGLTPIASEWWHFNDLATVTLVKASGVGYATSIIFDECISKEIEY